MAKFEFTVTTTADDGAGSLRQAIADAQVQIAAGGEDAYAAITFAPNLDGQTIFLQSRLNITSGDIRIYGDSDGDGDADITISGDSDQNGQSDLDNPLTPAVNDGDTQILRVGLGSTVLLDGLTLDRATAFYSDDVGAGNVSEANVYGIGNFGDLTIRNSTISNSYINARQVTVTLNQVSLDLSPIAAPIMNGGTLRIADTLITGSNVRGADGRDSDGTVVPPSIAGKGADAAGGVFNKSGATLLLGRAGFDGTVLGGQGGDSVNNFQSGAGGDAALISINRGTIGRFENSNLLGAGVTGATGGGPGQIGTGNSGLSGDSDSDIRDEGTGTSFDFFFVRDGVSQGIVGTAGNDILGYGGEQNVQRILGFAGNDTIRGGQGGDTIYGGSGNDDIRTGQAALATGGAGNDLFRVTSAAGSHSFYGGDGGESAIDNGFDTISFYESGFQAGETGVTVNLGLTTSQAVRAGLNLTLFGFERLVGSLGNDVLIGDVEDNTIFGAFSINQDPTSGSFVNGGADTIAGGAGDDYLANAGDGARLYGQADDDYIVAVGAGVYASGGTGSDTFIAISGSIAVRGGGENLVDGVLDVLRFSTGQGVNFSLGVSGPQAVTSALTITSHQEIEGVSGSTLNDTISGSDAFAGRLFGQNGADRLTAGAMGDELNGGDGDDTLTGGAGGDTLAGGDDNDRLAAGAGTNVIDGGAGTDTAVFGGALSAFAVSRSGGTVTISRAGETSTITNVENFAFSDGARTLAQLFPTTTPPTTTPPTTSGGATGGPDRLFGTGAAERIAALGGDDTVAGRGGDDRLLGQSGDDRLLGQAGDDTLLGGAGKDTALGGGGGDQLKGQGGDDQLKGQAGNDTILGGGGSDTAIGGGGNDQLKGQSGSDTVLGGGGADTAGGGGGDDLMRGQAGDDRLLGQAGDDTLQGSAGDDQLIGAAGADLLDGGRGSDTLTGGAGADRFQFAAGDGNDRITDFVQGQDQMAFRSGAGTFGDLAFAQQGADVLITHVRGAILVEDANVRDFDASDFIFT